MPCLYGILFVVFRYNWKQSIPMLWFCGNGDQFVIPVPGNIRFRWAVGPACEGHRFSIVRSGVKRLLRHRDDRRNWLRKKNIMWCFYHLWNMLIHKLVISNFSAWNLLEVFLCYFSNVLVTTNSYSNVEQLFTSHQHVLTSWEMLVDSMWHPLS